jgi:hypothetical protein
MYAGQGRLMARMNEFSLQQGMALNTDTSQLQTAVPISIICFPLLHELDVTPGQRYCVTYPTG